MTAKTYNNAATSEIAKKLAISEGLKSLFMKMDGVMFGPKGEASPYQTQRFDSQNNFLGDGYDVENGVLAVVAWDSTTASYATFVTKSEDWLVRKVESARFHHESGIGVPHAYDLNLFPNQTDREAIVKAYGRVDECSQPREFNVRPVALTKF